MKNRIAKYDRPRRSDSGPVGNPGDDGTDVSALDSFVEQLQPTVSSLQRSAEAMIRRRPLLSLTAGMIAGVTLGCLIKRR